ncbi:MAG: hybrid sensor histidine kinase/response regulator [Undibacterium sp.]|nr:hybrid sensor histidine kinase/response regulator [Undibacterium sp.]
MMRVWPFASEENRVLLDQSKLVIKSANSRFLPSLFAFTLLYFLVLNAKNSFLLSAWFCCTLIVITYSRYLIRRSLRRGIELSEASRLAWRIIVSNLLFSLHWSSFLWITLDSLNPFNIYLALVSNAVLMALYLNITPPVLFAYIVQCVIAQFALSLKLELLGPPYSKNTWLFCFLGVGFFVMLACKQYSSTKKSIQLELEKQDLILKLELQSEKLRQAQCLAEDANQAKTRFLAAASHDIRQPIHALGLFLEVLRHSSLSPHQTDMLKNAHSAFNASTEMLDTLLDFSRLESGVVEIKQSVFYLQSLLNKLESEFEPQATKKGLVFRMRESDILIYSDPFLLELILRNLLGNAIRYTERGGIFVCCRRRGDYLSLEIWDTGIGIPVKHQADIFREFYRLQHSRSEQRRGLGLGLAIAQGFARTLEHQISVNSRINRGSVFRILIANTDKNQQATYLPAQTHTFTPLACKILLIDDDQAIRAGMQELLRLWKCDCDAVASIDDALSAAHISSPDLIISDYCLNEPGNGVEAIQLLRERVGRVIPAIVLSGDAAPEQFTRARMNDILFLSKPISPIILHQSVMNLFEARQLNQSAMQVETKDA